MLSQNCPHASPSMNQAEFSVQWRGTRDWEVVSSTSKNWRDIPLRDRTEWRQRIFRRGHDIWVRTQHRKSEIAHILEIRNEHLLVYWYYDVTRTHEAGSGLLALPHAQSDGAKDDPVYMRSTHLQIVPVASCEDYATGFRLYVNLVYHAPVDRVYSCLHRYVRWLQQSAPSEPSPSDAEATVRRSRIVVLRLPRALTEPYKSKLDG